MKWIIAVTAAMIMMMPQICRAQEKLLVTDVLEKGEMEVGASFSYSHFSDELSSPGDALSADRTVDTVGSGCALNVGLWHGLEVGAAIPYLFSERLKIQYPTVPTTTTRLSAEGFGDVVLRGKYRILGETDTPFTLVAGLDVKLDSASEDEGGTGTTDISPSLAASTVVAESIRPFARYTFVARDHGAGDSHEFLLGAEKELNDDVGLQALLEARLHTTSDTLRSYEAYVFEVQSYIRIWDNFYAVPKVIYTIRSPADFRDSDRGFNTATSVGATFGFYCLF
jgi:hypothetical protein